MVNEHTELFGIDLMEKLRLFGIGFLDAGTVVHKYVDISPYILCLTVKVVLKLNLRSPTLDRKQPAISQKTSKQV